MHEDRDGVHPEPQGGIDFDGVRMRTCGSGDTSVVSEETTLVFEQLGDVVSARYRGGRIVDGYLIGHLDGVNLHFRYVQTDVDGHLDAGVSDGTVERVSDGRLRLVERFQWITRPESGINIFEEIADREELRVALSPHRT